MRWENFNSLVCVESVYFQFVKSVIVHCLHIHDMATGGGVIKDSPTHFGQRTRSDGDAKAVPWTFSPLWCSP
ncbi:hypothetical protein MRB53_007833 [Persea americana]|uniref:Uncharacterized protein n=1 Tax=Persea americana TaxID=3435 RepID=A0ACC2ML11_PERAE|nr:hypothetical protein MRB53_007833 [Persea americana]